MLDRVLEPEVMDTRADAAEYAAIDNRAINALFVEEALALGVRAGRAIDLGTGPGDIALALAQAAPELAITAVDLAEHMLALGRARSAALDLAPRIRFVNGDAKATGFPASSFDLVVCNSVSHHIPRPLELFREIRRIVRPGGAILLKDLHRPAARDELDALVALHAGECTDYQRRQFGESLHASLTAGEAAALLIEAGFAAPEVERTSDRHWVFRQRARA